jgi:excisionase family DNA binding protein
MPTYLPLLLTTKDLCKQLQLSERSIYRLIKQGLPSILLGRSRRFELDRVKTWLASFQMKAKAKSK